MDVAPDDGEPVTSVPRAPELRPRLFGGTALTAAREMRLVVESGALVLHLPGGERQVLAPAGAAVRTLQLTPQQELRLLGRGHVAWGALLVTVDGSPRALLRLSDFGPPNPLGHVEELPWASGAVAVASALGTVLEPVTDDELAGWGRRPLRRLLVDPVPAPPAPGRWSPRLLAVAGVVTFVSFFAGSDYLVLVPAVLALLLAAPVYVAQTRYRRRGHAGLLTPPPVIPGAVEVAPVSAYPVPRAFKDSRLYVSPDVVVLRLYGQESWYPGPARGGAARAAVTQGGTRLFDGGVRSVTVLPKPLWYATPEAEEALVQALRSGGLQVDQLPLDELTPESVEQLRQDGQGYLQLPDLERGDVTSGTPYFAQFVSAMQVVTTIVVAAWNPVAGAVYAAAFLSLAVPLWVSGYTQAVLFRRARRLVP